MVYQSRAHQSFQISIPDTIKLFIWPVVEMIPFSIYLCNGKCQWRISRYLIFILIWISWYLISWVFQSDKESLFFSYLLLSLIVLIIFLLYFPPPMIDYHLRIFKSLLTDPSNLCWRTLGLTATSASFLAYRTVSWFSVMMFLAVV